MDGKVAHHGNSAGDGSLHGVLDLLNDLDGSQRTREHRSRGCGYRARDGRCLRRSTALACYGETSTMCLGQCQTTIAERM